MAEITLDLIRVVIREELESLLVRQQQQPKRRPTRRERVAGIELAVSCTEADARMGWAHGRARDLYLAGKLKGEGTGEPGKHCKVLISSCERFIGGKP